MCMYSQTLVDVLGGDEYFRSGVIAPYGISMCTYRQTLVDVLGGDEYFRSGVIAPYAMASVCIRIDKPW